MSYGKVHQTFWTDPKSRAFSDDAKLLAVYLVSGPHRAAIGAMRLPIGYIVSDLRWKESRIEQGLLEMERAGFIVWDRQSEWLCIINQVKYDPPTNPNQVRSLAKAANEIGSESIRQACTRAVIGHLKALSNDFGSLFEGLAKPFETPGPVLEQDHDHDHDRDQGGVDAGADAPPPLDEAFDEWNALAEQTGLPAVQNRSDKRRSALKARLTEAGGLEGWRMALAKIRGSPFLLGRQNGKDHPNWRADFDFIVTPRQFTKLMEGGYDQRTNGHRPSDSDRLKAGIAAAFADVAGQPAPDRREGPSGQARGHPEPVENPGHVVGGTG